MEPGIETEEENPIRTLAGNFYQALVRSERFSRMSLFETADELQRPRIVIYLQLKSPFDETPRPGPGVDIGNPFADLAVALRDKNLFLDMYYGYSLEEQEKDVKSRYGVEDYVPKVELLLDEQLPETRQ